MCLINRGEKMNREQENIRIEETGLKRSQIKLLQIEDKTIKVQNSRELTTQIIIQSKIEFASGKSHLKM